MIPGALEAVVATMGGTEGIAAGAAKPSMGIGSAIASGAKAVMNPIEAVAGFAGNAAESLINSDAGEIVKAGVAASLSKPGEKQEQQKVSQAQPVYSQESPKQRLADVSGQARKVETPARYYGSFGAAAPVQQQKPQPEPFDMASYFAEQFKGFSGR